MPTPTLPRLSPTLLAILASGTLLSGCDLWGSGASSNNATVSEAQEPIVIAQMEEASSANGGYLFGKTNVTGVVHDVDENGDPIDRVTLIGQQLHIIDPSTGTEVGSGPIDVDADSTQVLAQSFTVSSDGLSQQANNINNSLFFTDGHRLYKVGLARSDNLEMQQQVSSEEHICQLIKAIPKDANATRSWIVLTATRTAEGDCAQADDVVTKVVSSEAGETDGVANSDLLGQVLAVQRDALGNLLGVLSLAPAQSGQASRQLVMMHADGSVSTLSLNLAAGQSASYFDRVAGSTTKAYLRITNGADSAQLYAVDWSTGTPSLSRTAAATLAFGDAVFVHADTKANYFVDGLSLQSINASTGALTTLATLGGAPQAGGVMTASYLVVPQLNNESGALSLQSFSKTQPGNVHDIAMPQAGGALNIVAHNADVLIVSQALDPNSTQVTLWRVDLNQRPAILPTPLTPGATVNTALPVTLISATQAASETLSGEQQQAYVLWTQSLSGSTLSVTSYQLSTAQSYVLSSSTDAWDLAQATSGNITQGLLMSTTGTTDKLWSFDAGKAASLVEVPNNNAAPQ